MSLGKTGVRYSIHLLLNHDNLPYGFGCDLNHVNEGLEFYIEEKLVSI